MKGLLRLGFPALAALSLAAGAAAADAPTATAAWTRATPPGSDVAAVYLTIHGGKQPDRLVSASTPRAAMAHLHAVEVAGGVSKMRPVAGVDVPAGGMVKLAPQGLHLMLMGVERPLVAGETFPLTLHFEHGGDLGVTVEVRSATAAADTAPQRRP
jgi:periplasmic copper chaperone A